MMAAAKRDDSEAFKSWLAANGAEVLVPTNEYEVVRFRTAMGVSIIYRKGSGVQTFTGEAGAALDAFRKGKPYRLNPPTERKVKASVVRRTLLDRDGPSCFYCGAEFYDARLATVAHGGPDHIANKALACADCNRQAGHLSLVEKIKLRDRLRAGRPE
jgi:hypothetical protein